MSSKSIKKNILLNMIYQMLVIIIPLITTPYVTRILGVDGIGIYSFTISIVTYFTMLSALGTSTYGIREISRSRDDIKIRSKKFWEIEILTAFTTLISLILWGIVILINTQYKIYFIVLTLNLFNVLFDITWFYSGIEEFKYTIFQNSIFKIIGMTLIFVLIKNADDLLLYFLIMSISTLLGTMSMWVYLKKFITKVNVRDLQIFSHLKQTIIYFIPTIVVSLYTVLDKTFIGLLTHSNSENGYYEEANKILNVLKALTFTSMNTVLGSRLAYLFTKEKYDEIKNKIEKSINYVLMIGIGICFGLIMMSDRFMPWYLGADFKRAALFLKIMSPLIVIIGISNCLGAQFYTPAGLRKESTRYIVCGAVTNIILNVILIPILSGVGAIIASIIAEVLITFLYIINSRKLMTLSKIMEFSYKKIIAAVVMSLTIYIINVMISKTLLFLVAGFAVGVCCYTIILYILKDATFIEFLKVIKSKFTR